MEGNKNFGFGSGENSKEEIRNLKLMHGHVDLGASEEAEETFAKSFKITHEKNQEFINNDIGKFKLELLKIDKELEECKNKEIELYTKIKSLKEEFETITVYYPGYDSLTERVNAAKGEFEKNADKIEILAEKKEAILNKITSFYRQMENQTAIKKTDFGGIN